MFGKRLLRLNGLTTNLRRFSTAKKSKNYLNQLSKEECNEMVSNFSDKRKSKDNQGLRNIIDGWVSSFDHQILMTNKQNQEKENDDNKKDNELFPRTSDEEPLSMDDFFETILSNLGKKKSLKKFSYF